NRPLIYADSKNFLDPSLVTLAEVLNENGYRTGHFGKWHLGIAPEHRPGQHGFETTWFCVPDPGPPSYFSPYGVNRDGRPTGKHKVGNIEDGRDGEYITDRLTDEAIAFLKSRRDEPFFLNLWQYGVHGPWGHKESYTKHFAEKEDARGEQRNPIMASMLKSVDDSLGRILDTLDELDLTENTLFVFFSDNGGNTHSNGGDDPKLATIAPGHAKYDFVQDWRKWAGDEVPTNNAPLREGKGRIYEGGQRVPLMVRWPGRIAEGVTSGTVVHAIDLFPTLLAAAGLETPNDHTVDGLSLIPVLEGKGELEREAIFNWFPHLIPAVSVRAGDYKLISRWEPHHEYPDTRELYDLSNDLGETRNLASEMPEKVAELEEMIATFIAETGALEPIPNPAYAKPSSNPPNSRSPDAGLVPKFAEASVADGAYAVTKTGRNPFLGSGAVKELTGPITATFRMRGSPGGSGRFLWKTSEQEQFPKEGQIVEYTLSDGEAWQTVSVSLPIQGKPGIIRLYLPKGSETVEFESIRYEGAKGESKEWDFSAN
ncbi:MAG: sulfatase-like hydrolase/transferase, partial [Verrucomicrobiota bacterium]